MATTYENWLNRRKGKQSDLFKLDTRNKTPEENVKEIIQGLYIKKTLHNDTSPTNKSNSMEFKLGLRGMHKSSSDSRRLSYLNALVTLLCKEDRSSLGFTPDELMTCIRVSLVDESMAIRASGLRVLRYLIKTESDVATFNNLKLPYLVIRSMDLMLRNEEERAQALRVVRRVVAVVGASQGTRRQRGAFVDHGLLRCLAAVARAASAGDGTGDRLSRPAVATLAEICVLNPELFVSCGGVAAVSRQLAECATPRMAEALCGVLLHALNAPTSRRAARLDLVGLSSPYCDFHFRPAGTETSRDEREMRFTCSRLALLCVLRSWPGLLHFCHPRSSGGLKALVAALYLPRLEVRKAILDLLYELVGLPQPEWTDEISVALDAVDPSDFQDSWRLNEGFVAAEGIAILPHLGATGPDIIEIHLAVLLQCFLEAGLLDGLAEVIVTSDTFISVRATVLLGQLLQLVHVLVPAPLWRAPPALGALLAGAARGSPGALAAVAGLRALHALRAARPAACTLFLDHVLQCCSGALCEPTPNTKKEKDNANMLKPNHNISLHRENSIEFLNDSDNENEPKQRHSVGSRADVPNRNVSVLVKSKSVSSRTSAAVSRVTKTAKFFNLFERDSDSLIRCSLVMQNKDGNTWDWEIIRTILRENDVPLLNLNDSGHKAWVTRMINYLKPSSNKYSHTDLSSASQGHSATRAGCQLIRHLLRHNDIDCQRLLEDLFSDVSRQIEAIETGLKAHECLFSPQHMCNTMCQMYFLFIGQLCHSQTGLKLFKQTGLYENLLDLSTKTHHSCYVKLVISSLDYTLDSYPRDILAKTLTCNIQASRLYTTQFLNVLLRASRKSRELVRRKAKIKKNVVHEHLKSPPKDIGETNNGVDMDTWILQMLVGQVKDESKAVVKLAISILEEAYQVPYYVEKLITMKELLCQNCHLDKNAEPASIDFATISDRGYLLWLSLEVAVAVQSVDAKSNAFLKKHLDFWTKSYNYRYVRLVEAGAHEALAVSSENAGRGARARRAARAPPHLHAALLSAAGPAPPAARARALLATVLPAHYKILQRKKCATEQEIADIKASLWAIGNTAVTSQGLHQLMSLSNGYLEDSVLVHIVRLAKYNPVYSVRATAFYVLGLIGSTYDGANLLSDLGWLCVRHTRHDQFPVIAEETYASFEQASNLNCYVTSPECRYNNYDTEMSEHSDHTDQSVAESLHSDITKLYGKTGSISAEHSEIKDQDVLDNKGYIDGRPDKRKSQTLPSQGYSTSHDRPTLSESRTVDILRDFSSYDRQGAHRGEQHRLLIGRMNSLEHAHEGRVRNTSESSTSGVSSCDSFLGKYAIPDRVLTLSPIPSSSSLYGMKSSNSSHRPKISDLQRRTSTSSFSGHDVASSPPSHLDMTGYATLKSLNRRPHVSESAATGSSDMDDLSWLLSDTNRRSKPFSSLRERAKSTKERMTKLSLLEYDWKPLCAGELPRSSSGRVSARAHAPAALAPPAPAPAYIGICLPKDLMELFPRDEDRTDDDTDKSDHVKRDRIPSFLVDTSSASTENKSRATPDSLKYALHKASSSTIAAQIHKSSNSDKGETPANIDPPSISIDTTDAHTRPIKDKSKRLVPTVNEDETVSTTNEETIKTNNENKEANSISNTKDKQGSNSIAEQESTRLNVADVENVQSVAVVSEADNKKWQHVGADCLACVRTRPPSSHELREAFFASKDNGMESPSTSAAEPRSPTNNKTSPQAELLHQVHFMSNPIHLRQARSVLLSIKQRHPEVFRSPCVYSDVCALLSRDTYMLCARRFVQELFLDTSFDCFATEPAVVLTRHGVTSP